MCTMMARGTTTQRMLGQKKHCRKGTIQWLLSGGPIHAGPRITSATTKTGPWAWLRSRSSNLSASSSRPSITAHASGTPKIVDTTFATPIAHAGFPNVPCSFGFATQTSTRITGTSARSINGKVTKIIGRPTSADRYIGFCTVRTEACIGLKLARRWFSAYSQAFPAALKSQSQRERRDAQQQP